MLPVQMLLVVVDEIVALVAVAVEIVAVAETAAVVVDKKRFLVR